MPLVPSFAKHTGKDYRKSCFVRRNYPRWTPYTLRKLLRMLTVFVCSSLVRTWSPLGPYAVPTWFPPGTHLVPANFHPGAFTVVVALGFQLCVLGLLDANVCQGFGVYRLTFMIFLVFCLVFVLVCSAKHFGTCCSDLAVGCRLVWFWGLMVSNVR